MSAYEGRQLEDEAARLGAYAFLHKPLDSDTFASVVSRAALRALFIEALHQDRDIVLPS
jgi:hypothetical protein